MKKTLFILALFLSTAAFGQYYVGSNSISTTPNIPQAPDHPAHASYISLGAGQSVLGNGNYASAQGERPASDFPQAEGVSLGAAARELKKDHALAKKSHYLWVN